MSEENGRRRYCPYLAEEGNSFGRRWKIKEKNIMEELVKQSIEEIKPFLKRDGGDIEFVELTPENVVKVRLKGACHGCPGAQLSSPDQIVERIVKRSCS